ncbi:DMT family transporter [Devosia sp.]|uniref:DMT family transporter n=1 Tax=Devosia sp. TaxID=1871048 RepID=UPI003A938B46
MNELLKPRRNADNVAMGIGLALVATVIFGVQDALAKLIVQDYSPFQLAMIRYWAFAAFAIVLAARQGPLLAGFRSAHPRLQILRGVLLVGDIWFFANALVSVPLAELQGITLVYPLLTTLLAIPILGEKVGVFRLGAVALGFAGALVIVRPGGLPLDAGVLYAMLSAALYALYTVLTRKVSAEDSTATSMLYVGMVGLVLTSAVGVFFWAPVRVEDWWLIGTVGVTSVAAHGLMMVALGKAPASVLQPFNYMTLPWAVLLSYTLFGHLIDPVSLLGALIVVSAGLIVMARERRLARKGRSAGPSLSKTDVPPH